jgi:hypothetical protein
MDTRQKRIVALGQRFSAGPEQQTPRTPPAQGYSPRRRHSVYIDAGLMKRIDALLSEVQHSAYPVEVTKSLFLEKLLERGLQDLEAVKNEFRSA